MDVRDFVARIPESQAEARNVIETVASAVAAFRKKAADVRADKRFTATGHRERLTEISGAPKEFLRQMRENLAKDQASVRERRNGIDLPRRSDDPVDEMRAAEIRSYLRGLSKADAARAMLEDPKIALAALHAPRQLSGLDADLHTRIRDQIIDQLHGPELLAIRDEQIANEQIAAVLAIADHAVDAEAETTKPNNGD